MFDPITICNISTIACGTARDRVAHRSEHRSSAKAVEVGKTTTLASREIGHKLLSPPDTKAGQLQRACLAHLLSKREVLAISNVSHPDPLVVDAPGQVPALSARSAVMWVLTEIEAWMAALPRCRLKKGTRDRRRWIPDRENPRNAAALRAKHDPERDEPSEVISTSS